MYFAFGDVDCFVIVDLPDNVSAAALSLAVNESGMIASKAIVLLTPEEMDKAGKTKVHFRAPGKKVFGLIASNAPVLRAMAARFPSARSSTG